MLQSKILETNKSILQKHEPKHTNRTIQSIPKLHVNNGIRSPKTYVNEMPYQITTSSPSEGGCNEIADVLRQNMISLAHSALLLHCHW